MRRARGDLRAAVQALGPLREFAAAVPGGPRWIVGVVIGLVSLHLALGLRLTVEMTGVEGFFSGTRGEPGLAASWFSLSRGTWPWGADRVDLRLGILPLVIAGVVLVLVADPWRRRRTPAE